MTTSEALRQLVDDLESAASHNAMGTSSDKDYRRTRSKLLRRLASLEADSAILRERAESAERELAAKCDALEWLVNLFHGNSKAGGLPHFGEWHEAIAEAEAHFAARTQQQEGSKP